MASKKRTVNKSAFVRSLPNLPASAVVAKAKAEGITLSDKYVYNVRGKAKANGGKAPGRPGRSKGSAAAAIASSVQEQFVELALQLGFDRSDALLKRLRDAIRHAVIG